MSNFFPLVCMLSLCSFGYTIASERDLAFCRQLGRYFPASSKSTEVVRVISSQRWQVRTKTA